MVNNSMIEAKFGPDIAKMGLSVKEEVNDTEMRLDTVQMRNERRETKVVFDNMQLDSSANGLRVGTNESVFGVWSNLQETEVVLDNVQLDYNGPVVVTKTDLSCSLGREIQSCAGNANGMMTKAEIEHLAESLKNMSRNGHCESVMNDVNIDIKAKLTENVKLEMLENCNSEVFCLEPSPRNKLKEASNDDVHSEVLNPNVSPKHIDPAACGEITSAYCRNSSSSGSLADEDHKMDKPARVVLEIPKEVSTTGVRKITFKFSKRKEDCSRYNDSVAVNNATDVHGQFYENPVSVSSSYSVSGNGFHNHEGGSYEYAEKESNALHGSQSSLSYHWIPNNVKKLLATRILDRALVRYKSKSGEKEITGIIKDGGYLCGCQACNFSTNVVSAYEFERHAGTKTRHPNNHIYLENGRRIYSIIEELKTATISNIDEVIRDVAGSSVNEDYFELWKANIQCGTGLAAASAVHQQRGVYPSSISHPSQPNEDSLYPTSLYYSRSISFGQQSYQKASVERNHPTKKPRHHFLSSGGSKKRDNDLHKALFMPNGLPDGTELGYYAKGKKVLRGYKQGYGIFCLCCYTEISPSQFETHAGWAAKRQPYRHIYTSSGVALHEVALMLANGQSIITSGHDDMCAVCGDASELILCSGCPRAFHAGCLGVQYHPTNDWHCPHCSEKFGLGKKASGESRPLIVRFTRVVKEPEFEPGGCVLCRSQEFSAANFDDKTVIICDQCEKEYHVGCLRETEMCDLKELPEDKWFCCDACTKIFTTLQTMASDGPEVIPASLSAALYKKHSIAAGQSDGYGNEVTWRILSGKSRSPDHLFLLSRAAEIFRECFDPIVSASGRDLIPVMVYGRNISGQEFSGMYCVVLTVKDIVVSACLLRIFGLDAAELPIAATGRVNQGKGYFRALFSCIERFLLSLGVKNLVLPAAEDAEPMWTKKLGFRKMSNEQMVKYRDLQLTTFMATSLLSKEVQ